MTLLSMIAINSTAACVYICV